MSKKITIEFKDIDPIRLNSITKITDIFEKQYRSLPVYMRPNIHIDIDNPSRPNDVKEGLNAIYGRNATSTYLDEPTCVMTDARRQASNRHRVHQIAYLLYGEASPRRVNDILQVVERACVNTRKSWTEMIDSLESFVTEAINKKSATTAYQILSEFADIHTPGFERSISVGTYNGQEVKCVDDAMKLSNELKYQAEDVKVLSKAYMTWLKFGMGNFDGGHIKPAMVKFDTTKDKENTNMFEIERVIYNDPATIVMWKDGTKTVVKASNEDFDPEKGLSMAIAKKALGNKHDYYITFQKHLPKQKKKRSAAKIAEWDVTFECPATGDPNETIKVTSAYRVEAATGAEAAYKAKCEIAKNRGLDTPDMVRAISVKKVE